MVLHVLADAAQFMRERYAHAAEMPGVANPRQLQDVRRADGTCRQGDLARRIGPPDQTSVDIASLCPNAETTVYPWREPRN